MHYIVQADLVEENTRNKVLIPLESINEIGAPDLQPKFLVEARFNYGAQSYSLLIGEKIEVVILEIVLDFCGKFAYRIKRRSPATKRLSPLIKEVKRYIRKRWFSEQKANQAIVVGK